MDRRELRGIRIVLGKNLLRRIGNNETVSPRSQDAELGVGRETGLGGVSILRIWGGVWLSDKLAVDQDGKNKKGSGGHLEGIVVDAKLKKFFCSYRGPSLLKEVMFPA